MLTEQAYIHPIRARIQGMYNDPASRILFWTIAETIPIDMRGSNDYIPEPLLEDDDWAVWKPIPSSITNAQIEQLEQECKLQLPLRYRAFLQACHLLDWELPNRLTADGYAGGCRSFIFPTLDTAHGLSAVKRMLQEWSVFHDTGYIPFAIGEDGQGIVCFDTAMLMDNGDCPIVWILLDTLYELPDASAQEDRRALLEKRMEPIFASFDEMMEAVFENRKH
ncbi:SMI1/KNR4 family protein [Paenibacillus campi]|uniref:SMI1/KNR4 family protein n=1 Tax=Paenibacillus campi TaxID=3106031 RepID=UPI002AFDE9AC|nr:SMI1/KNR4 family protein [Paenibacillus sp. SGZ-1009]